MVPIEDLKESPSVDKSYLWVASVVGTKVFGPFISLKSIVPEGKHVGSLRGVDASPVPANRLKPC